MISLRRTIITRVIVLVAAIGLSGTAASFVLVTLEMNSFLDAQLQEIAINLGPGKRNSPAPLFDAEDEDHLVIWIWDRSGNLVHRSGPTAEIPWQPQGGLSDVTENGQEWRVYRVSDANEDIQIAQRWSARREIATHAATGAALPFLVAIPLAWLVIGWSINRTLRGLHTLASDIGHRSVDAQEPLRPDGVPEEIVSLIRAIDELVERHRQALEAQRRFVADAAHELRTPLAAVQIQIDNILAADLTSPTRELAEELGAGVRRASRLASQLLEMARTEGAAIPVQRHVDLTALVTSVLPDFFPLAEAKEIDLAVEASRTLWVNNDPNVLRKLVSILLENAIRYSTSGASIEIKLDISENTPRLEIADGGPGIPEEILPFIYDRFFRAAPQEIEGTGLGLAIAKKAAERNGLRLSHRNRTDGSGIIATIEFPCGTCPAGV